MKIVPIQLCFPKTKPVKNSDNLIDIDSNLAFSVTHKYSDVVVHLQLWLSIEIFHENYWFGYSSNETGNGTALCQIWNTISEDENYFSLKQKNVASLRQVKNSMRFKFSNGSGYKKTW